MQQGTRAADRLAKHGEPCMPLPWDSVHFGASIARVAAGVAPDRAIIWAREHDVQCLYLLVDLQEPAALRSATAAGFTLVDVRVTLDRPVEGSAAAGGDAVVRTMEASDLPALQSIAEVAHVGSRFYADPRFDHARVTGLYREWLRASVQAGFADWALTAVLDGAPIGYITGRIEPGGVAGIGLLGVDEEARGHGIGSQLVDSLLGEAAGAGCSRITVVTQGSNVRAQRLYQRTGFRTLSMQAWFHWWA
jgi:ribosomal protein S18 acetylase RimI-like enzyme